MSKPRRVVERVTYFVTRRVTRRHFLFRPDEDGAMQRVFWYCLAIAAKRYGVIVHAVVLMSDHYHLVITDVHGVLPRFLHCLNRNLANATKCLRGWPEEVLNKSQTSAIVLRTSGKVVEKIGYTIVNPVNAGLVRFAREWPGAKTTVDDMGRRVVRVERPKFWFSKTSDKWPEWVELAIELPAALVEEHGGDEDAARAELAAEVERQEQKAHAEMRAAGRTYLGAKRAMKVPFTARASSYEEYGALNPTFAAEKGEEARQAAREHKQFLADYAAALKEWRAGNRDVVFPHGTWLMRVLHGARSQAPP